MNRLKQRLIIFLVVLTSLCAVAQSYHFQEGFDMEGRANTAPDGWSTATTYPTKNANKGIYTGERCVKFNSSESDLTTPVVHKADQLSFWAILLDGSDGKEELLVEVKRGDGDFETAELYTTAKGDLVKNEWQKFTIDIDETSATVQVRFSSTYGGIMKTLCVDDIALTYTDSEEVLDDTEYAYRYYVDASNGDDNNSGKSEVKAWKTFAHINGKEFQPRDTILLKCNNEWNAVLEPQGSGDANHDIVLTSYGEGLKPLVNAQGKLPSTESYSASILLKNDEHWKIENIAVKNFVGSETTVTKKYGILIKGSNKGTLEGFHIDNIEVSQVNGIVDERENGGLAFIVTGTSKATNFDGILIENSYFHDLANCGLFTVSSWKNRDFNSNFGEMASNDKLHTWYPSLNIVVRYNRFERTAGNGMVIRVADGPLVEYNTFYRCGLETTGNASYPFSCDNALWQFNEASHTVYNEGDVDASGFDSDYNCKNTIIQYNYSHDNDWGSILVCCNGGIARAFNDGTIVRYNIFQNDGHHMVRMSGSTTNTYIYNNVFYVGEQFEDVELLWHKKWNAYPDKTYYDNNIFYNKGKNTTYLFTESTHNVFSHNIFHGNASSNEPDDANKITSDPMFIDPGKGDFGFETLEGYQLQAGSPAVGAGKKMTTASITDFYGNGIQGSDDITIGAHQWSSVAALERHASKESLVNIYPNPVVDYATLDISNVYRGKVQVRILSLDGKVVDEIEFSKNSTLVSRVLTLGVLNSGSYLLQVNAGQEFEVKKIIKVDK